MGLVFGVASAVRAEGPDYTLAELTRRNWVELECIYRQAQSGRIPSGFAQGRVVYCPDAFLGHAKSGVANFVWKGKTFCAEDGTLINQWCGIQAIGASVSQGPSWLDGKPSIIIDYSGTSRVWHDVRDEMREISPGLYLGAMFLRRCPDPRLKLYFILQACD